MSSNSPLNTNVNKKLSNLKSNSSIKKTKSRIFDSDDSYEFNNLPKLKNNTNTRLKSKTLQNLNPIKNNSRKLSHSPHEKTGNTTFIRNRTDRFNQNKRLNSTNMISKNKKNEYGDNFFENDNLPKKLNQNIQSEILGKKWKNTNLKSSNRNTSISRELNKNNSKIFKETHNEKINKQIKSLVRNPKIPNRTRDISEGIYMCIK